MHLFPLLLFWELVLPLVSFPVIFRFWSCTQLIHFQSLSCQPCSIGPLAAASAQRDSTSVPRPFSASYQCPPRPPPPAPRVPSPYNPVILSSPCMIPWCTTVHGPWPPCQLGIKLGALHSPCRESLLCIHRRGTGIWISNPEAIAWQCGLVC